LNNTESNAPLLKKSSWLEFLLSPPPPHPGLLALEEILRMDGLRMLSLLSSDLAAADGDIIISIDDDRRRLPPPPTEDVGTGSAPATLSPEAIEAAGA
jgi:hypothetical protein